MDTIRYFVLNLYKKNISAFRLCGLFMISILLQFFLIKRPLYLNIGSAIFQFLSSLIISFTLVQLYKKYHDTTLMKWWVPIYIIIIILSVFALFIVESDFYPN